MVTVAHVALATLASVDTPECTSLVAEFTKNWSDSELADFRSYVESEGGSVAAKARS